MELINLLPITHVQIPNAGTRKSNSTKTTQHDAHTKAPGGGGGGVGTGEVWNGKVWPNKSVPNYAMVL